MALIASIPILLVIVLMIAFNKPAKIALPNGWVVALLIALFYWRQDMTTTFAWALDGFLEAIGTLVIIFGAILIMNTLKHSGAVTGSSACSTTSTPTAAFRPSSSASCSAPSSRARPAT